MNHKPFVTYASALCLIAWAFASANAAITLDAYLGDAWIDRASWGARAVDLDALTKDTAKEVITLHHTPTRESPAKDGVIPEDKEQELVQTIEALHVDTFKFPDIGYHFLVSQSGKVYEGRPYAYQGNTIRGLNAGNAAIAFLGCYDAQTCGCKDEANCPPEERELTKVTDSMLDAAAKLIAFVTKAEKLLIAKTTLVPRSVYETMKAGVARFPFSPGSLVIDHLELLVAKAHAYRKQLDASNPEVAMLGPDAAAAPTAGPSAP